jgi:hypothetical protein
MESSLTLQNVKHLESEEAVVKDMLKRLIAALEEKKAALDEKKEFETEFVQLKKNFLKVKAELKLLQDESTQLESNE